jgi:N-acetylmuramoyl-L-alanine amidase
MPAVLRPLLRLCALVVVLLAAAAGSGSAGPVEGTTDAGAAVPREPSLAGRPNLSPVRGRRINIDPGHNAGNTAAFMSRVPPETRELIRRGIRLASPQCDTGGTASYAGYREASFNWDVALRLRRILRQAGADVTLTRSSNSSQGPCTVQRAKIGNRAEVAISIHADGGDAGRGFHVIYPTALRGYTGDIAKPSYRLGVAIRNAMRTTGMPDSTYVGEDGLNGRADLVGLLLSDVPKVFLESGAMHNSTDAQLLAAPAFRERMARALAGGLAKYLKKAPRR